MTFAPRTWVVGEVATAALFNQEIRDQINSMIGAWTAYTPTWTSSGTNPSLGNNGTILGRYLKIGRTVACEIHLTTGSSTTYGSGSYNWSLPFSAVASGIAQIGTAQLLTSSNRWQGQIVLGSGANNASAFFPITATNTRVDFMTATLPETLAANAQIRLTFQYEAAS
ncbi:hypothetical protein ABTX35_01385 [Streptomyces sp. NPDC096080]|uniref:hypothetical protein n=1 Tax=Streptomyces sp. NPDC096080 TaxID=3156693 RepID=UPI00332EDD45